MNVKRQCENCKSEIVSEHSEFCANCGQRLKVCEELTSPLANVIKAAMNSKPDGPLAQMREKIEHRTKKASDLVVILADCSGSMAEPIGTLDITKFEHLKIALQDVLRHHPECKVVVFNSAVYPVTGATVPPPFGGTDLARGLEFVAKWRPRKTVIISDGLPDSEQAATLAADRMTGIIDTIYCGPDSHPAIQFLRSLSRDTGGVSIIWNGTQTALASNIRGLIEA